MKEFIRAYGKLAGLFAAAALVLSFLTGILARNPIGTVILRAVLLAVLFGGLGVGLQFVVKRFLPELGKDGARADAGTGVSGEAEASGSGSRVDITLPEENPLAGSLDGSDAGEDMSDGGAPAQDLSGPEGRLGAAELEEELEGAAGGGAEEAESAEEMMGNAPAAPVGNAPAAPVGNAPAAPGGDAAPGKPGKMTPGERSGASGGLDALPDIEGLESAPPRQGRVRSSRTSFSGAAVDEALRRMVEEEDPATLARAVHTVVKRDEKG